MLTLQQRIIIKEALENAMNYNFYTTEEDYSNIDATYKILELEETKEVGND
jgi:hypothetical protein